MTRDLTESRKTVAELRAGEEVRGVFACSRKDRLNAVDPP